MGIGQGATQILYGLAKREEEFFADNLSKVVLYSLCLYPNSLGAEWDEDGLFKYEELGINSINGPTWESDIETICSNLDENQCQGARDMEG